MREKGKNMLRKKNDQSILYSTFNYLQIFFNVYEPLYADCDSWGKDHSIYVYWVTILHNILSDTKITDNLNKNI